MDKDWVKRLLELGGMRYCSGEYTRQEWIEKTGHDPAACVPHIKILDNGFCAWTDQAENVYRFHMEKILTDKFMLTDSFVGRYGI